MHGIPDLFPNASHTAVAAGGSWSSPLTWVGGVVPGTCADVSIPPGVTVLYDVQNGPELRSVRVGGTLRFANQNVDLKVTYLVVLDSSNTGSADGHLEIGTQASPFTAQATITIMNNPIDMVRDPLQWGTGLIVLGRMTTFGVDRGSAFSMLARDAVVGDTTVTLKDGRPLWKVGDDIVFPDPRQGPAENGQEVARLPTQIEIRKITALSADGKILTLNAPLTYAHGGAYTFDRGQLVEEIELKPHVGNLTRNITIRSENTAITRTERLVPEAAAGVTRGHVAFIHHAIINVRGAAFVGLGRTLATRSLETGTMDPARLGSRGEAVPHQNGRYAAHFHHVHGVSASHPNAIYHEGQLKNFIFADNSITQALKFGIVVHQTSFGIVKNNFVFDVGGSGIYFEDGNEYDNSIISNFILATYGIGTVEGGSGNTFLPRIGSFRGSTGDGIYLTTPSNRVIDNVVANATAYAYVYFPVYVGTQSVQLAPGSMQTRSLNINAESIMEMRRNVAYASYRGISYWWVKAFGTLGSLCSATSDDNCAGEFSVMEDVKFWHIHHLNIFAYESTNMILRNFVSRGDWSYGSTPLPGTDPKLAPGKLLWEASRYYFPSFFTASDYVSKGTQIINADVQGLTFGLEGIAFQGKRHQKTSYPPMLFQGGKLVVRHGVGISHQWTVHGVGNIGPNTTLIKNLKIHSVYAHHPAYMNSSSSRADHSAINMSRNKLDTIPNKVCAENVEIVGFGSDTPLSGSSGSPTIFTGRVYFLQQALGHKVAYDTEEGTNNDREIPGPRAPNSALRGQFIVTNAQAALLSGFDSFRTLIPAPGGAKTQVAGGAVACSETTAENSALGMRCIANKSWAEGYVTDLEADCTAALGTAFTPPTPAPTVTPTFTPTSTPTSTPPGGAGTVSPPNSTTPGPPPSEPAADPDEDGVPNSSDNCPSVSNPDQHDSDGDQIGDLCDTDPGSSIGPRAFAPHDLDGDGVSEILAQSGKSVSAFWFKERAWIGLGKVTERIVLAGNVRGTGVSTVVSVANKSDGLHWQVFDGQMKRKETFVVGAPGSIADICPLSRGPQELLTAVKQLDPKTLLVTFLDLTDPRNRPVTIRLAATEPIIYSGCLSLNEPLLTARVRKTGEILAFSTDAILKYRWKSTVKTRLIQGIDIDKDGVSELVEVGAKGQLIFRNTTGKVVRTRRFGDRPAKYTFIKSVRKTSRGWSVAAISSSSIQLYSISGGKVESVRVPSRYRVLSR